MAVISLYDTKSFLNRRRKFPVSFPAEQHPLSAMCTLLGRAAPVLNRSRTVHRSSLVLRRLNGRDQRFYSHSGVDFIGLGRAAKVVVGSGQKSQGASTITMQVARNFFLTH